jgi:hypothetical protein
VDVRRNAGVALEGPSVGVSARCVEFCALPGPTVDAPIEQHGSWCVSRPIAREVRGRDDSGLVEITVDLVSAFGRSEFAADEALRYVRASLASDHDGDALARLTPGEARTLAAALTAAAAQCEQLDLDLDLASAGRARYLAQVPRA